VRRAAVTARRKAISTQFSTRTRRGLPVAVAQRSDNGRSQWLFAVIKINTVSALRLCADDAQFYKHVSLLTEGCISAILDGDARLVCHMHVVNGDGGLVDSVGAGAGRGGCGTG
jgi:hypothetical protein